MLSAESKGTMFERRFMLVSVTNPHLETDARRGRKEQSSSPAPKAKAQTDGKIPSKGSSSKGESPSWTRGRIPCKDFQRGKCTNSSCNLWHPVCYDYKSESGTNGEK